MTKLLYVEDLHLDFGFVGADKAYIGKWIKFFHGYLLSEIIQ